MNNLTKHTPGPWKAVELDEEKVVIKLDRPYSHECIHIADVHIMSGNLGEEVPKAVANAELIARAPELLEENESFKNSLSTLQRDHNQLTLDFHRIKQANKELLEALEELFKNSCYKSVGGEWYMWARGNDVISKSCLKAKELISKHKSL